MNNKSYDSNVNISERKTQKKFILTTTEGKPLKFNLKDSNSDIEIESEVSNNDMVDTSQHFYKNNIIMKTTLNDDINHILKKETKINELSRVDQFKIIEWLYIKLNRSNATDMLLEEVIENLKKPKSEISLNLILRKREKTMSEKLKNLKEKKYSCLEIAKLQFNKVTLDKISLFSKEILDLKINTVDEMKELASFVFVKAITEKAFLDTYTKLIGILKKNFKCDEEKNMGKESTCFFASLLKLMMKKIEENHTFNRDIYIDKENKTEIEIEEEIENAELARKLKRTQAIGAISFCVSLYKNSITGVTNIKNAVNFLTKKPSSENIELLCEILRQGGPQLNINHSETVNQILHYIETHNIYGPRMEIIIEQTIEKLKREIKLNNVSTKNSNIFANLFISNTGIAESEEKINEREDIEKYFEEEILPGLGSCYEIADLEDMVDIIVHGFNQFNQSEFVFHYFTYVVTDNKNGSKLIELYSVFLADIISNKGVNIFSIIKRIKNDLNIYYIDYPCSKIKYPEMLCFVKSTGKITNEEFNALKVPDFEIKVKDLVYKWHSTSDERLHAVFNDCDIDRIINTL